MKEFTSQSLLSLTFTENGHIDFYLWYKNRNQRDKEREKRPEKPNVKNHWKREEKKEEE